jgi:hypothetical protein
MPMKTIRIAVLVLASTFALPAAAGCVNKGAVATAGSTKDAKWFAMETMVQGVSWSLWPGWLSTGKVEGYTVKNERYKCGPDGGQVTCHSRATFCTKG